MQAILRNCLRQYLIGDDMVGCDPEIVFSQFSSLIPAIDLERRIKGLGHDGHAPVGEIRPIPSGSLQFIISNVIGLAHNIVIEADALEIDVWSGAFAFDKPLGGHLHFSRDSLECTRDITNTLDCILGNPLNTWLGAQAQNRKSYGYGHASDVRTNKRTFEYRTPPSWLTFPFEAKAVLFIAHTFNKTPYNIIEQCKKLLDSYEYSKTTVWKPLWERFFFTNPNVKLLYNFISETQHPCVSMNDFWLGRKQFPIVGDNQFNISAASIGETSFLWRVCFYNIYRSEHIDYPTIYTSLVKQDIKHEEDILDIPVIHKSVYNTSQNPFTLVFPRNLIEKYYKDTSQAVADIKTIIHTIEKNIEPCDIKPHSRKFTYHTETRTTYTCFVCNSIFSRAENSPFNSISTLCSICYPCIRKYFVECSICHNPVYYEYMQIVDEAIVCDTCFYDIFYRCNKCGKYYIHAETNCRYSGRAAFNNQYSTDGIRDNNYGTTIYLCHECSKNQSVIFCDKCNSAHEIGEECIHSKDVLFAMIKRNISDIL